MSTSSVHAIVAYEPSNGHPTWKYEQVNVTDRPLETHELRVRMTATGICHSDIYVAGLPGAYSTPYPKVLGHEGAGFVEEVGSAVTTAKVGDPVLLSYNYCKQCDLCSTDQPPYCDNFRPRNMAMQASIFTNKSNESTSGKFFGQSSFSAVSIVEEPCIINATSLIHSPDDLRLFAPLGCGFMTGAGCVFNSLAPKAHDILVVAGIGAVGFGAIMAAKVLGTSAIVAVDRVQSRLDLAKELGATHTLNTSSGLSTFVNDIQALVENKRITMAIDTTGVLPVLNNLIECLGKHGRAVSIGIPPMQESYNLPVLDFYSNGKSLHANMLGDAVHNEFVPKMIQWYREGKFPIDKLVKYFPASQIADAMRGMETGDVVKPVLLWDHQ